MADERINLFLLGIGNVGQAVIQQIYTQKLPIRICGIARSTTMVTKMSNVLIDGSRTSLETALGTYGEPLDLAKFIKSAKTSRSVLVDCTANPEVADQYMDAIKKKIPVVTSNKLANSEWAYKNYTKLREESRKRNIPTCTKPPSGLDSRSSTPSAACSTVATRYGPSRPSCPVV